MLSLLAALAAFASEPIVPEPSPATSAAVTTPQDAQGSGTPVLKDARITVHFLARTDAGAVVADTESRGLAFTFLMEQDTVASFWHDAVRTLRIGGVRTLRVRASKVGLALPEDPMLTVTVRVVKVAPLT